jgi:hypothetical protein
MKRLVIIILVCISTATACQAATLGDLLYKMNWRLGEPDSSEAFIPDTAKMIFLDLAQVKIARMAGNLPKQVDFTYSNDSVKYALPSDFIRVEDVVFSDIVSDEGDSAWFAVLYNPGFKKDTVVRTYDIKHEHPNQAELYLRGTHFYADQIVRVFYLSDPPAMVARTDSCHVPTRFHGEIIEEAISYYEKAKRDHAAYQLMNQTVRLDLGILKKEK